MTPNTLTIYGAKGGAGTSTVAAALALMSAEHGPTVLVSHDGAPILGAGPQPLDPHEAIEVRRNLWTVEALPLGAPEPVATFRVIDAGTTAPTEPGAALLVTRPCYLALRRTSGQPKPAGIILLTEPGRALTAPDVAEVVGAPVVAELAQDPAVARAIDAGLLASRLPRTLARSLRHVFDPLADEERDDDRPPAYHQADL